MGAGLGSSAAYSVALAGAFHRLNNHGRRDGRGDHVSGGCRSKMELFAPDDQVIARKILNKSTIKYESPN